MSIFFVFVMLLREGPRFLSHYSEWLTEHEAAIGILVFLFLLAIAGVLMFPAVLIMMFFIEGIKMIRHEGMKPSNMLSMLFSILLFVYLAVWPVIGIIAVMAAAGNVIR